MQQDIPFRDIAESCRPVAETLCRRWLPHGHRSGNWWKATVPWRPDKTPSLAVSLTTAHWKDLGNAHPGRESGDMIKLFSIIYGVSMVEAADAVAQTVGHSWRKRRAG